MSINLFDKRALLFLPASNPRAIAKARESEADLVILDLEDAVRPEDKETARRAAIEAVAEPWPMAVAIRINGVGNQWHGPDLVAITHAPIDLVVMPRVEDKEELTFVRKQSGKAVAAMIETAKGVLEAHHVARDAAALIAGTNDLSADLRLPHGAGRPALRTALHTIILAARSQGIAVFDGVYNQLDDLDGFSAEALEGRMMGFDGKSLIHPSQIAPCHAAFAPTEDDLARAARLVAASTGGAERFEGEMIERMHVESAKRMLARYPPA
jgi:citrate lyase subunit beta/citryl-CoA lyase